MSAKAEPDQPLKAPAGWEFSGISFWLSLARYRLDQSHDGEWSVYGEGSLGANSLRRRKYWQWSIPEPPDEVPSSSVVAFTISSGTPESIADYKEAMRAALPIDDYAPMLAIRECCGIVGLVHCHQDRPERQEYNANFVLDARTLAYLIGHLRAGELETCSLQIGPHELLSMQDSRAGDANEYCFPESVEAGNEIVAGARGVVRRIVVTFPTRQLELIPATGSKPSVDKQAMTAPPARSAASPENQMTRAIVRTGWIIAVAILLAALLQHGAR